MYTGRNYPLGQTVLWTSKYILIFIIIGLIPLLLNQFLPAYQMRVPWLPISLIGIAVAFYLGFKNNSSYDRLWEARKIWGGIVNDSRTWTMMIKGYVRQNFEYSPEVKNIQKQLVLRHVAWLHALRFQLRQKKQWEHKETEENNKHLPQTEEKKGDLLQVLSKYIIPEELRLVETKKNRATHLLDLQMNHLTELRKEGLIDDFRHMELGNILRSFYALQGKCERIKNFPFPRQYASLNIYFVWIFIILLPFGLVNEFDKLGSIYVWFALPFSVLVSWIFHTMELIGDYSENPFEGLNNDVPITALSRTIEIDLLEMINMAEIPESIKPTNNILM